MKMMMRGHVSTLERISASGELPQSCTIADLKHDNYGEDQTDDDDGRRDKFHFR